MTSKRQTKKEKIDKLDTTQSKLKTLVLQDRTLDQEGEKTDKGLVSRIYKKNSYKLIEKTNNPTEK